MVRREVRGISASTNPRYAAMLGIALSLLFLLATVAGVASQAAGSVVLGGEAGIGDVTTTSLVLLNATPCDVLSSDYGNGSGSVYWVNYTTIFAKICRTPQFASIYDEGLTSNGTFVIGEAGQSGSVQYLTFSMYRTGPCDIPSLGQQCVFQADWTGYLTNNSYSGPYLSEYPAIYIGGPVVAPGGPNADTSPWLDSGVAIIVIGAVVSVTVLVARKRASLRKAVLHEDREMVTPTVVQLQPSAEGTKEPNNRLEDIF